MPKPPLRGRSRTKPFERGSFGYRVDSPPFLPRPFQIAPVAV